MNLPRSKSLLLASAVALACAAVVPAQIGGAITQLGSGGRSFNDAKPDIAYDPVTDVYAHVFEGGAGPHTIQLKLFDAKTGAGITGGDVGIARGTNDYINPCVAYIAKTGMFLVAWQVDNNGNWDIECRPYDPATKTLGPIVTVAATAADEITPDIAGDGTKVDDDAILVWDDETVGVRAAEIEVQSPTVVTVATPITLAPGGKPLNNNPGISRSGGAGRRVAVAWEVAAGSMTVRAYTMDLVPASAGFTIPVSGAFPELDGDGSDFLVVFNRAQPSNASLSDVWCCALRVPQVAALPLVQSAAPRAVGALPNDERHPTVAFVGGTYLAAWGVVNLTDQWGQCQIQSLMPDCTSCGTGFLIQYGNRQRLADFQAVGSVYNSDATTAERRARVLYDTGFTRNNAPASLVQKVNYDVVGGTKTSLVTGCGTGGTLSIPEPFAFGEPFTALLGGADNGATGALAVLGFQGARAQFSCTPCSVLLGPFVFGVGVSGGSARFGARVPCDPVLNNVELDLQYVVLTPASSPCPVLPGLSTSNIMRATVQ